MNNLAFNFEFTSVVPFPDDDLRIEARQELVTLTKGHTDITGAAVAIEEMTDSKDPNRYRARIVVYMRPSEVVATEKAPSAEDALRAALDAVERQVREQRDKLREHWKQP